MEKKVEKGRIWVTEDKLYQLSRTRLILLWKTSFCAAISKKEGQFAVGLRLASDLQYGSDVPGIFAAIHPCSTDLVTSREAYWGVASQIALVSAFFR